MVSDNSVAHAVQILVEAEEGLKSFIERFLRSLSSQLNAGVSGL